MNDNRSQSESNKEIQNMYCGNYFLSLKTECTLKFNNRSQDLQYKYIIFVSLRTCSSRVWNYEFAC